MALTKAFILGAATTPRDARLMDLARVCANANGTPRTGVLGVFPTGILTALGSMNVQVAAATFATSRSQSDGVSIFSNDGAVNVPITAAPVSNSRITVIWVKHNDSTQGDANDLPVFGTTDGNAAASPTKPAIPTGAEELGTLRVFAGTTAANGGANVLTQTFSMTAMQGGIIPIRNETEREAWTGAAGPSAGQRIFQFDESRYYYRASSTWRPEGSVFFSATRKAAQALAVGWNLLAACYGTAVNNDLGTWTGGALTITRTGTYRVNLMVNTTGSTTPGAIQVTKNQNAVDGVGVIGGILQNSPTQGLNVTFLVELASGDVLRSWVYTIAANTIDTTGSRGVAFSVELVRPA